MFLQKILYPQEDLCSEKEMYYRGDLNKSEAEIEFDTYFNSFSIEKWRKYTDLDNLSLRLTVSGQGTINVINSFYKDGKIEKQNLQTLSVNHSKKQEIEIKVENLDLEGTIYLTIENTKNFQLHEGGFWTELSKIKNDIKIGLVICTFKREEFIRKNIKCLKDNILNCDKSELKDNLEIFIIDNAHTLDQEKWGSSHIHYIQNKNVGGAGGFTRGLIETTFGKLKMTHCIFMDDDVIIEPSVLEKNFTFLSLLKTKYKKCFLGGAILYQERMYMQLTSGERWSPKGKLNNKFQVDLRVKENVVKNEIEEDRDFSAWCYCCIPTEIVSENNLPLPIFIHMDDIEYGIRNKNNGVILLNGICVWHPDLVGKGPITNRYYDVRNNLIMQSIYGNNSKGHVKRYLLLLLFYYLSQYKYVEAEYSLMGYRDFYEGIDQFKKIDGEKLHMELLSSKYPMNPSNIQLTEEMKNPSIIKRGFQCILGMISYICPQFLKEKIYTSNIMTVNSFFSKQITIFDVNSKKEFVLKRDYKRFKKCFQEYRKICKIINQKNDTVNKEWKERIGEITNLEFWKKYLNIK